jgi:hypothetical protein
VQHGKEDQVQAVVTTTTTTTTTKSAKKKIIRRGDRQTCDMQFGKVRSTTGNKAGSGLNLSLKVYHIFGQETVEIYYH